MLADERVLNTLRTGEKVMAAAYGLDAKSVWSKAADDSKFLRRITRPGASVTVRKMHEVACWLAVYWPRAIEWPADGWWRPSMDEASDFVDTLPDRRLIMKINLPPPRSTAAPRRSVVASSKAAKKGDRARKLMDAARSRAAAV